MFFPLTLPPLASGLRIFPASSRISHDRLAAQNGWKEKTFSEEAIGELRKYGWPETSRTAQHR